MLDLSRLSNSNSGHKEQTNIGKNENERHLNPIKQSDVPEWALINELDLRSNRTHEEVMIIQAMLHGYPAKLLLDSGASGNFINESFVNRWKWMNPIETKWKLKI